VSPLSCIGRCRWFQSSRGLRDDRRRLAAALERAAALKIARWWHCRRGRQHHGAVDEKEKPRRGAGPKDQVKASSIYIVEGPKLRRAIVLLVEGIAPESA
jgi:hypothetical protein